MTIGSSAWAAKIGHVLVYYVSINTCEVWDQPQFCVVGIEQPKQK